MQNGIQCLRNNSWKPYNVLYVLTWVHWGKADDRNCNYGHPKMVDVESGKNLCSR